MANGSQLVVINGQHKEALYLVIIVCGIAPSVLFRLIMPQLLPLPVYPLVGQFITRDYSISIKLHQFSLLIRLLLNAFRRIGLVLEVITDSNKVLTFLFQMKTNKSRDYLLHRLSKL